jgi:DNA-binding MarR family transcriptional regulator
VPAAAAASDRLHTLLMELARFAALLHPDQATPQHSMPLSQIFALHELDTDAPLSQRELARRLCLEKSTLSRLVTDMEGQGLLVRQRDPGNRRYSRLQLTGRGRAVHAQVRASFHHRHSRLMAGLSITEREALLIGLPALIRALRDELS